MAISRVGILREDVRKSNKQFYSLKDKQTNFYTIPDTKYLISSGIATHNIYAMYDLKEIWTIVRFINRVKHYTVKEL
jgi:hypothetical protein